MDHYKAGSTISFRIPSDTSPEVIEKLNKLKTQEGRGFSKKAYQIFENGLLQSEDGKYPYLLPLEDLTDDERRWLEDEKTKALIQSFVELLVRNPKESLSLIFSAQRKESGEERAAAPSSSAPSSKKFEPKDDYTKKLVGQFFDEDD